MKATLTSKGQITLPARLRQRLGLRQGDQVKFVEVGGQWTLQPVHMDENPFAAFVGAAPLPQDAVSFWRTERGWDEPDGDQLHENRS